MLNIYNIFSYSRKSYVHLRLCLPLHPLLFDLKKKVFGIDKSFYAMCPPVLCREDCKKSLFSRAL